MERRPHLVDAVEELPVIDAQLVRHVLGAHQLEGGQRAGGGALLLGEGHLGRRGRGGVVRSLSNSIIDIITS